MSWDIILNTCNPRFYWLRCCLRFKRCRTLKNNDCDISGIINRSITWERNRIFQNKGCFSAVRTTPSFLSYWSCDYMNTICRYKTSKSKSRDSIQDRWIRCCIFVPFVPFADSKRQTVYKKMQEMLEVHRQLAKIGLRINKNILSEDDKIIIFNNSWWADKVPDFKCIGYILGPNGQAKKEIATCITVTRNAFFSLEKSLWNLRKVTIK